MVGVVWLVAALYGFMGRYIWPLGQGYWPHSAADLANPDMAQGLKVHLNPLLTLQAVAVVLYALYAWRAPALPTARAAWHHGAFFAVCFGWLLFSPHGYNVFLCVVPLVGIPLSFGLARLLR